MNSRDATIVNWSFIVRELNKARKERKANILHNQRKKSKKEKQRKEFIKREEEEIALSDLNKLQVQIVNRLKQHQQEIKLKCWN